MILQEFLELVYYDNAADYERKLRNMQDGIFEQNLDLVYFSKVETRFDKNYLQNLLKIEALIQRSVANFYMETKN